MNVLRNLKITINRVFYQNYTFIALSCCVVAFLTAYLHYEWEVNDYDLISWKKLCEPSNLTDIDYTQLLVLFIILVINIIFVGLIIAAYMNTTSHRDTELTLIEIKNRFSRFILLRLIARLDRIQGKLAAKRKSLNFQHFARAQNNMAKAVAIFRKDARKLILPNESEIMQPIEVIYGVADDEERALTREGYYKIPIDITDATVKGLFTAH